MPRSKVISTQELQVVDKLQQTLIDGELALLQLDVAYALLGQGDEAYDKILYIKNRPKSKPCVVLGTVGILEQISEFPIPPELSSLTLPLGIVTKLKEDHPLTQTIPAAVFTDETVAIFVNMGQLGNAIAKRFEEMGKLTIGSSGNISGAGNHFTLEAVEDEIKSAASLIVDGGPCKFQGFRPDGKGLSSTMVNLKDHTIIRHGLLEKDILSHLGW